MIDSAFIIWHFNALNCDFLDLLLLMIVIGSCYGVLALALYRRRFLFIYIKLSVFLTCMEAPRPPTCNQRQDISHGVKHFISGI